MTESEAREFVSSLADCIEIQQLQNYNLQIVDTDSGLVLSHLLLARLIQAYITVFICVHVYSFFQIYLHKYIVCACIGVFVHTLI